MVFTSSAADLMEGIPGQRPAKHRKIREAGYTVWAASIIRDILDRCSARHATCPHSGALSAAEENIRPVRSVSGGPSVNGWHPNQNAISRRRLPSQEPEGRAVQDQARGLPLQERRAALPVPRRAINRTEDARGQKTDIEGATGGLG